MSRQQDTPSSGSPWAQALWRSPTSFSTATSRPSSPRTTPSRSRLNPMRSLWSAQPSGTITALSLATTPYTRALMHSARVRIGSRRSARAWFKRADFGSRRGRNKFRLTVGKSIIRRFFGTVESGDFAIFDAIRARRARGRGRAARPLRARFWHRASRRLGRLGSIRALHRAEVPAAGSPDPLFAAFSSTWRSVNS
jgi:hypothetical protein